MKHPESGLDVYGSVPERDLRSTLAQKAMWAIYEEKHFRGLIEDVTDLVDSLVELFPGAQVEQRQRCVEEVMEMGPEADLPVLEQAAEGVDELFRGTVQSVIESQGSHTFTENTATGEARVSYGDERETGETTTGPGHRYDGNEASGKSRMHYGNKQGGKGVLDD